MNPSAKRGKARGPANRGRRITGSPNHPSNYIQPLADDSEQSSAFENTFFVHAITSLLGCRVQLTTPGGVVYDGILKAVSPKVEVALDIAHKVTKKTGHGKADEYIQVPSRNDTIETLVFAARNIVSIVAANVDRDQVIRRDSFTDQAISNKVNGQVVHERELKKWEDPGGGNDMHCILGENELHNGLDADEMLAINEQKFGVKSSFDSEMLSYTTALEKSTHKDFKERERKAEILAQEIEQDGSYAERSDVDSGKTEEELYSSVVRSGTPTSGTPRYLPPARRNRQMQGANREEAKSEGSPDRSAGGREQTAIVQPKPQRLPQSRSNVPDTVPAPKGEHPSRPVVNNQDIETLPEVISKRDTTPDRKSQDREAKPSNTSPLSVTQVKKAVSLSPVSGKPALQVAGAAAQEGISISQIIAAPNNVPLGTNPVIRQSLENRQPEGKNSEIADLKTFKSNFKLVESSKNLSRPSQEEKRKQETLRSDTSETQKTEPSRATPSPKTVRDGESPKSIATTTSAPTAVSVSGPTTTTPAGEEHKPTQPASNVTGSILKTSTLNPNAKEFNPMAPKDVRQTQPAVQRTPPLASTPQPYHQPVHVPMAIPMPAVPYSPTSGRPVGFGSMSVPPQSQAQIYKPPRSPVHSKPVRIFREPGGDPTHASPTVISAAIAAGNPIIAPSMPQQYIAMGPPQNVAFPSGMVQQMIPQHGAGMPNVYVLPAGQPVPPRFVQPQSAGMTTATVPYSVSQAYQEGGMPAPVYVASTPPHQSPAQASPSHQSQFFQYHQIPQMMQQQPPGMPPQTQGHMGAPSPSQMGPPQQFVYLPQPQGAPQQPGGPQVHQPGPPMGQFIPDRPVYFPHPIYVPRPQATSETGHVEKEGEQLDSSLGDEGEDEETCREANNKEVNTKAVVT